LRVISSPHVAQDEIVEAFVLHVATEADARVCYLEDSRWSLLRSVDCAAVKSFTACVASNTGLQPLFG
jgi:hypothetical protein